MWVWPLLIGLFSDTANAEIMKEMGGAFLPRREPKDRSDWQDGAKLIRIGQGIVFLCGDWPTERQGRGQDDLCGRARVRSWLQFVGGVALSVSKLGLKWPSAPGKRCFWFSYLSLGRRCPAGYPQVSHLSLTAL